QEFRVQTNAYDASIGRQAGSTVNMQTRSGGKDYHGSLYEFNQSSFLNANLFQTNLVGGVVPPVHFNEFGGTVGGPVWIPKVYKGKDKTFFFFSYDTRPTTSSNSNNLLTVPTAQYRVGDFSAATAATSNRVLGTDPLGRNIIQNSIYDPKTERPASATDSRLIRDPFVNNTIPTKQLDPVALRVQA